MAILIFILVTILALSPPIYLTFIKDTKREIGFMEVFGYEYVLNEKTGKWYRVFERDGDKYIDSHGELLRLSAPEETEHGTFYAVIGNRSGMLLRKL